MDDEKDSDHCVDAPIAVKRLMGSACRCSRRGRSRAQVSRARSRCRQRMISFFGLAFGGPPGDIGLGGFVVLHPHDDGAVERGVGLPVATAIESVPVGYP